MESPFDRVSLAELSARRSAKWRHYPKDVLPAWVAEMDFPLAEPIARALHGAIDASDAGYAHPAALGDSFVRWAAAHQAWNVEPRDVRLAPDVVTAIAELLRVTTAPGDGVVIDPPVYPPFAGTVRALGRTLLEAPLARIDDGSSYALDLDAIAAAYAKGARVHVLCSPHNPTGVVHDRATLERLAALAEAHGVLVLSDEIHAPLTLAGATHHAFPTVSEAARRRSIVLTSASKTWNLAGLKAALVVASSDETRAITARLPADLPYHAGHFGVIAARAAFEEGEPWRREALDHLDRNRRLLSELLAARLPEVRYTPPAASYLAWLDCRALGLGRDPARVFLEEGRVALSPGPTFGPGGDGFARLNFATTRALLEEAVDRMVIGVRATRTTP